MTMQEPTSSPDETRRHFGELVASFATAMLVTRTADGELRARPLTVAGAEPSGEVYFSTSVEAPKVHEIEADARVVVTFQNDSVYVSLTGTARLSRDRALVERLWKESWKVWFPKGKEDPTLAIVIVAPTAAEYWDQRGLAGLRYVLRSLEAYVTGTKAPDGADPRQNAKVPLR
ncbi:MAG TPA: pyridoxamine 5'-phosphate oxidase family protein [Polyangia bacterium]|nr:pyridoxamine 5'-phosphate oxidase family protein [Polyangia bacterium]